MLPLSGPGVGLPPPQNLYPSQLNTAPYDSPTNRVALAPGEQLLIPAGDWIISMGGYLVIQYFDPITGTWTFASGTAHNRGLNLITSDGFNVRIANLTGCPVGAVVTAYGSGYVQSSTTISVTGGGGSTWAPIVGGQLSASITTGGYGAGYGVAPIILVPDPPGPSTNANGVGGIPASAYANLTAGGTVNTVSLTNPGAGYPTAPPNALMLPNPTDPNIATGITLGTVLFSLVGSGSITGVLMTNPGAALALPASITLAVAGAGATATVQAIYMSTVTAATVASPGVGYGLSPSLVMTVGGYPPQGTITNGPDFNYLTFFPRPAQISLTPSNTSVSAGTAGVVYDGGLCVSAAAPTSVWVTGGTVGTVSTIGNVALVMGSRPDIAIMQPFT